MQFSAKTRSKGFALLITVTLLAFLVLLLVSLASLTRVETQVASNNQQLAQARQNALMALNIALGQLQKYVGPDQRTTARSDMDIPATSTTQSGRWTGAYGNGVAVGGFGNPNKYDETPTTIQTNHSAYYTNPSNASDPYVARGSPARLLNWLVSGNESTTFVAATSGQITTKGTGITYSPTDAVVLGGATALATDTKVKNLPARILVGPNSATHPSDYVAAPLVPISAVAPGLGATAVPIGNYAWWVGDEGTKARINLPMSTAAQAPLAFVSSQRAAIELVDGKNPVGSTTSTDLIGTAYPTDASNTTDQANLINIVNKNQLPMLTPASATALTTAVKYRFHDLTSYSMSVLSDTYAGGLKKDLSVVLAPLTSTGLTSPMDTDFIFTPETNNAGQQNELGLPTWGALRSFATMTDTNGASTPGLTPQVPALQMQPASTVPAASTRPVTTTVGISPIMTYIVAGFKYIAPGPTELNNDTIPISVAKAGNPIRLALYPVVVLWNPYTTDIIPQKYEVGIQRPSYEGGIELAAHSGPAKATYVWSAADKVENRNLCFADATNSTSKQDPYFRFIVNSTKGIKAGQSVVFTLQSNGANYISSNPSAMLSDEDYFPLYYVLLKDLGNVLGGNPPALPGTAPGSKAGDNIYRVGVNRELEYVSSDSKKTAQTYFTGDDGYNAQLSSRSTQYGWEGNGSHQAYIGAVMPASAKPSGSTPYTMSGSTVTSRQWYQSMSWLYASYTGSAPFGSNKSFPTDSAASSVIPTGWTNAGRWTGLVQSEGRLEATGSMPAWRMIAKAQFQELSAGWVSARNPRGFQVTGTQIYTSTGSFLGGWPTNNDGGMSGTTSISTTQWPPFSVSIDTQDNVAKAGSGSSWWQPNIIANTTLFEFRSGTLPLLSIGQLQHANLAWIANNPAYTIGNSLSPPFLGSQNLGNHTVDLPAALDSVARTTTSLGGKSIWANGYFTALYDQSWLLNRALWDKYFVSTISNKGTGTDADTATFTLASNPNLSVPVPAVLPNSRHIRYNVDATASETTKSAILRNVDTAAAHLILAGGFNINSTSEQAWRAVLGSSNQLSYDPTGTDPSGAYAGPVYSRFSKPTTNSTSNIWLGYRRLTNAQIAVFAKNIVDEIRNRGPFISLADFINRRLADNVTTAALDERTKGTIQAALDNTTNPTGINPAAPTPVTFAPQYLTQADVLSTIGSGLSARSDTFVIRTYGEVLDAVNSTASAPVIGAQAWCEAVVQRLPDYVDPLIAPETQLHTVNPAGNPALALARTTNLNFGRKFKIISFRWLTPNDI